MLVNSVSRTMAALSASPSLLLAGDDCENKYDVYLSFFGPDTRFTVAGSLYSALVGAGFRVFNNDEELRPGVLFIRKLRRAITRSKIYIPIFSRGYASSKWCLREIAYMVECKKKSSDKVILPILYGVDARDLSLGSKLYRNALERHSSEPGGKDVKKQWEEALIEVARIEGLHLRVHGLDKLIELAMEKVCGQLGTKSEEKVPHVTSDVHHVSPTRSFRRPITFWRRVRLLGSGSFGTVYEGSTDDGFSFAVKEVSLLDPGNRGKQCVSQLEKEIFILRGINHKNIVQYLGTDKDDEKLYIFLELMTHGSLAKLYQQHELRDSQVSIYTSQILLGLKYLHEKKIVHRDIKCANILVDANGSVKLADFGLAKATIFGDAKTFVGTLFWMAPEVFNARNNSYGFAADIWSLGCTVLEMLTRKPPYSHLAPFDAMDSIRKGELPEILESLSEEARHFILQCLQFDANRRPTAAELLNHPFVRER